MTRAAPAGVLPRMSSVTELVAATLRAATHQVSEGSRRNAREALEVRYDLARQGVEALAALPDPTGRPTTTRADRAPLPRQQPRTAG